MPPFWAFGSACSKTFFPEAAGRVGASFVVTTRPSIASVMVRGLSVLARSWASPRPRDFLRHGLCRRRALLLAMPPLAP